MLHAQSKLRPARRTNLRTVSPEIGSAELGELASGRGDEWFWFSPYVFLALKLVLELG